MNLIDRLIDSVRLLGVEWVFGRFYGTYRAEVADVEDPEKRGRVRLRVPALGHTEAPKDIWARPIFPGSGSQAGHFWPPNKGDLVWVTFENGDHARPLYLGGFIAVDKAQPEFDSDAYVERRGIKTAAGHFVRFSDEDSDKHITITHATGAKIDLDKNGSVIVESNDGSSVKLDAQSGSLDIEQRSGGKVTISSSGDVTVQGVASVTVKAAAKAVVDAASIDLGEGAVDAMLKGTTFLPLFLAHTHLDPLSGTTGPVLPALAAAFQQALSNIVKTR